jgi:L-threonylcarbamoyladenylate synthase
MITAHMLSKVLGKSVKLSRVNHDVRTAGMHHLHYAPVTKTSLIDTENIPEFLSSVTEDDLPIALITHSPFQISKKNIVHKHLARDARKYAHDMYSLMRELDHQNVDKILIENVPEGDEWDAVRDRLNKASGREVDGS